MRVWGAVTSARAADAAAHRAARRNGADEAVLAGAAGRHVCARAVRRARGRCSVHTAR